MNKYKNYPMFEIAASGEGGRSSQERMDFAAVSASRTKIGTDTTNALKTLESGTELVNTNFGTNGAAMRGGASNYVNTRWNALTTRFANFSKYITQTLDNVQLATKTNEAFEDKVQELFAQLGMEDDVGTPDNSPVGPSTSVYYSEK